MKFGHFGVSEYSYASGSANALGLAHKIASQLWLAKLGGRAGSVRLQPWLATPSCGDMRVLVDPRELPMQEGYVLFVHNQSCPLPRNPYH